MVKLFCALVGSAGSAFPVEIDASESVGDLENKIKAVNAATITCDARELQLYLAKKGDTWLPSTDRDSRRDQYASGGRDRSSGRDWWSFCSTGSEEEGASRVGGGGSDPREDFLTHGDSMLLCMVMDIGLPISLVMASLLFRRAHDGLKSHFVQIEDIDDVRNGLLVFKPIKRAFDDLDIAFLVDKHDHFTLRVFNPAIKAQLLVDSLTQHQWDALGGGSVPAQWRTSTSPIFAPNAPQFNVLTTFGELDGQALGFPSGSPLRPFRRCLYHQALVARVKAISEGWVPEDYTLDDFSSEGFSLEEKIKLLFSSNLSGPGSSS